MPCLRLAITAFAHRFNRNVQRHRREPRAEVGWIEAVARIGVEHRVGPLRGGFFTAFSTFPLRASHGKTGMIIKRGKAQRLEVPRWRRPGIKGAMKIFFEKLAECRIVERTFVECGSGLRRRNGTRCEVR